MVKNGAKGGALRGSRSSISLRAPPPREDKLPDAPLVEWVEQDNARRIEELKTQIAALTVEANSMRGQLQSQKELGQTGAEAYQEPIYVQGPISGIDKAQKGLWEKFQEVEGGGSDGIRGDRYEKRGWWYNEDAGRTSGAIAQSPDNKESDLASTLFDKFQEVRLTENWQPSKQSLITKGLDGGNYSLKQPWMYAEPFCDFLSENPTVFHAVDYFERKLEVAGFVKLSERQSWTSTLKAGGKYYISRNGSSLNAFTVDAGYQPGNGVAIIAGHIDALTAKLKPVSTKKNVGGYVQLGVAPYAGGLNATWWDRDLGVGGRVVVKDPVSGKISTKVVKLDWPIARIPTLAPHFGEGMMGQNNKETQAVPIIGLADDSPYEGFDTSCIPNLTLGSEGSFAATQPPKLVRAISKELGITDYSSIINWELELFDTQKAGLIGLDKEFISGGRIDDKVCSWAAIEGLLASAGSTSAKEKTGGEKDGIVKLVALFDNEEIGSLTRQGARGNFLPDTIERIVEALGPKGSSANLLSQTYANSFMLSADVTHALNPNFASSYEGNHAPRLNVGVCICADANGHMTTDAVSTTVLTRIAEKCGSKLQLFMIRNDSRSGGTVGPILAAKMGVRSIDAGIPQLSMHSVRAVVGREDPGLGVKLFKGFLDGFESVDEEFQ